MAIFSRMLCLKGFCNERVSWQSRPRNTTKLTTCNRPHARDLLRDLGWEVQNGCLWVRMEKETGLTRMVGFIVWSMCVGEFGDGGHVSHWLLAMVGHWYWVIKGRQEPHSGVWAKDFWQFSVCLTVENLKMSVKLKRKDPNNERFLYYSVLHLIFK